MVRVAVPVETFNLLELERSARLLKRGTRRSQHSRAKLVTEAINTAFKDRIGWVAPLKETRLVPEQVQGCLNRKPRK